MSFWDSSLAILQNACVRVCVEGTPCSVALKGHPNAHTSVFVSNSDIYPHEQRPTVDRHFVSERLKLK